MYVANEPVPAGDMASRSALVASMAREIAEFWEGPATDELGCLECFKSLFDIYVKLKALQETKHIETREYPGPFILHEAKE